MLSKTTRNLVPSLPDQDGWSLLLSQVVSYTQAISQWRRMVGCYVRELSSMPGIKADLHVLTQGCKGMSQQWHLTNSQLCISEGSPYQTEGMLHRLTVYWQWQRTWYHNVYSIKLTCCLMLRSISEIAADLLSCWPVLPGCCCCCWLLLTHHTWEHSSAWFVLVSIKLRLCVYYSIFRGMARQKQ